MKSLVEYISENRLDEGLFGPTKCKYVEHGWVGNALADSIIYLIYGDVKDNSDSKVKEIYKGAQELQQIFHDVRLASAESVALNYDCEFRTDKDRKNFMKKLQQCKFGEIEKKEARISKNNNMFWKDKIQRFKGGAVFIDGHTVYVGIGVAENYNAQRLLKLSGCKY